MANERESVSKTTTRLKKEGRGGEWFAVVLWGKFKKS